jgi:DNA-binding SARP family transcriptional activator
LAGEISIELLGRFRVRVDGRSVPAEAWRRRRGSDLIKLLALEPRHRLHREQALDALWPELTPQAAAANLRKAVHYARRALEDDEAIRLEADMITLVASERVSTDAGTFEEMATRALRDRDPVLAGGAADLYAGPLLPDEPYEPWLEEPRRRLHTLFVEVLRLAERWDALVAAEPTDEPAHRALMRAHLEAGDRQAAMRRFERLREILRERLGVGPDRATVALYEQVLAAEGEEPPTPAERARSVLASALLHWNRMELHDARREAERARAIALEAGLETELGEASGLMGMVAHAEGRWRPQFRDLFTATLRETPDLAGAVFDAHLCLAEFSLHAEPPEEIVAFARELQGISERYRSVRGEAIATLMLGEIELLTGSLDDAERDLARAVDMHRRTDAPSGHALSLIRLAEASLARPRDRTRASALLREAIALARAAPLASHLVVRAYGPMVRRPRDARRAAAIVERADAELAAREVCPPCSMDFLVAAAIARARVGDLDGARDHLDQAERTAGMWQGGPWQAAVWEARGHVRRAEGDPGRARALFDEAADLFARSRRPLDETRARDAALAN